MVSLLMTFEDAKMADGLEYLVKWITELCYERI